MRKNSEREVRRQRVRMGKLRGQRQKLLDAFYAETITLDHLKTEQGRIAGEMAQAEQQLTLAEAGVGDVEAVTAQAMALATHCARGYAVGNATTRRQWNQAFFEKLL